MAKIHTFQSNFTNLTGWQTGNNNTVSGGQGVITVPVGQSGEFFSALANWDITDSSIMIKVPSISSMANTFGYVGIREYANGNNFKFGWSNSSTITNFTDGVGFAPTSFSYSAGMWFRIRHQSSDGKIYLDTSTDGITWTNRTSGTPTSGSDLTQIHVEIEISTVSGSTSTMSIQHLNISQSSSRYVVGTGIWNNNNTTIWSYTSGGVAGAIPPVVGNFVYINSSNTATLGENVACTGVYHTNGTLALSSYTLNLGGSTGGSAFLNSTGSTARTLNLGSGKLIIGQPGQTAPSSELLELSGTNLTLTAGTSTIVLNALRNGLVTPNRVFHTASKTFNDVIINLGESSNSATVLLSGSPTFRSLIIQSKNSAAHTVNFYNGAEVKSEKLILIGSSSINKLTIDVAGALDPLNDYMWLSPASAASTTYGQFVTMGGNGSTYANMYTSLNINPYMGSNSGDAPTAANIDWTYQNPPKISTLIDPLTTAPASNSNWVVTDPNSILTQRYIGAGGGGYGVETGSSTDASIISVGTYDLVDSPFVFEIMGDNSSFANQFMYVYLDMFNRYKTSISLRDDSIEYFLNSSIATVGSLSSINSRFCRISASSSTNNIKWEYSDDGLQWSTVIQDTADDLAMLGLRSTRVKTSFSSPWGIKATLGSINTLPSPPAPTNSGAFLQFF